MSQLVPRLSTEWLNSNQHRAYPLDDSTTSTTSPRIPTAFLVDALFFNSSTVDNNSLYISSVVQDGDNIIISMAGTVEGEATDFGAVAVIPYSTSMGTHVYIDKVGDNYRLSGSFVIGDTKCLDSAPPVITLDKEAGLIFPGCVRSAEECLLGIEVNGKVYNGVVTLEAGDGIEFDVSEHGGEVSIAIRNSSYTVPAENTIIVDDTSLLKQAMDIYGTPITSICGVTPTGTGDISLVVLDKDNQYVSASRVGDGAISLTIANDKTDTQCSDISTQIESLIISIKNLNDRSGEIHDSIQALDQGISNLSLQVSRG